MSTSAPAGRRSVLGSKDRVKTAVAAALGTSVENYDFIAYGTASALYFGAVFFPESDRFVGTLLSFATLAVGFVMRPWEAPSAATSPTSSDASPSWSRR